MGKSIPGETYARGHLYTFPAVSCGEPPPPPTRWREQHQQQLVPMGTNPRSHHRTGQRSGCACDWWGGKWKEDFKRALDTGQNAHRLSVEWSRIQPTPDSWDDEALDRYLEMVRWLVSHGMTPMVTLHHFTDPLWLVDTAAGKTLIRPRFLPASPAAWSERLKRVCQPVDHNQRTQCVRDERLGSRRISTGEKRPRTGGRR